MKYTRPTTVTTVLVAGAFLALATLVPVQSQETGSDRENYLHYEVDQAAASVQVDGDSTLHAWTVRGEKAEGFAELSNGRPSSLADNGSISFTFRNGRARFPVKSIEGEKDGLNEKMYEALKADEHQYITFEPESLELIDRTGDREINVSSRGELTIADKTRTVTLEMNIRKVAPGRLRSTGTTELRMTDFGIEPPTALGGTVTAYKDVTVSWNFPVVERSTPDFNPGVLLRESNNMVVKRYDRARAALVEGNADRAKRYLRQVGKLINRVDLSVTDLKDAEKPDVRKRIDKVNEALERFIQADDLETQRERFQNVTDGIRGLVRATGHDLDQPVRVVQCTGRQEGSWLSDSETSSCPYHEHAENEHGLTIQFLSGSASK